MLLTFSNTLPTDILIDPICISGHKSLHFPHRTYLLQKDLITNSYSGVFEIRYTYSCSPFKQAEVYNNLLVVGYEGYFYLFDLTTKKNIVSIEVDGYFGSFHVENDGIYVCDASALWRINFNGNPKWCNRNLGIDGVIISSFDKNKILGSGEWDPPGGWRDFEIDRESGLLLK